MGMDEKSADQTPQADCCLENTQPTCCQPAAGNAECNTPSKKPWIKTLVFILVMLAAVSVGAYSILSRTGAAEIIPPAANRGSPEKAAVNPAQPGSQVQRGVTIKPTEPCCPSQKANTSKPATPCCGSQEDAPVTPAPSCENECGRPCCGGE